MPAMKRPPNGSGCKQARHPEQREALPTQFKAQSALQGWVAALSGVASG
jgi:hypothetical protein